MKALALAISVAIAFTAQLARAEGNPNATQYAQFDQCVHEQVSTLKPFQFILKEGTDRLLGQVLGITFDNQDIGQASKEDSLIARNALSTCLEASFPFVEVKTELEGPGFGPKAAAIQDLEVTENQALQTDSTNVEVNMIAILQSAPEVMAAIKAKSIKSIDDPILKSVRPKIEAEVMQPVVEKISISSYLSVVRKSLVNTNGHVVPNSWDEAAAADDVK